jgi:hypothetical protein
MGVLSFFLVKYFISKFSVKQTTPILTEWISSNTITFSKNYQEILTVRLGNDKGYFITSSDSQRYILSNEWVTKDIIDWLDTLSSQDYAVSIEIVSLEEVEIINRPRIILSKEFMINYLSDPLLISTFIAHQINILSTIYKFDKNTKHILLIHFAALNASYD